MGPTEGRSSPRTRSGLGLLLCLVAGCAAARPALDHALRAEQGAGARREGVPQAYAVQCPDVLDVTVAGRPDLSDRYPVGPEGRLDLGDLGRLRVEGRGLPEIAQNLAEVAGVPATQVQVRVAEYRSRKVYLFGQVFGLQRAVPYQGPETVVDLLQRVGGVTPGAAAEDISVVRTRLLDGRAPEVFHIDLPAILSGKDTHSNIRVEPFDEIYVGETRQSAFTRCIPPCFKPVYQRLCGLYRRTIPGAGN